MEPAPLENQALFSNVNGILYASVSERYLPCKQVSQVLVRSQRLGGYSTLVQDSQAVESGILRRRLLNAVDDPKTPGVPGPAGFTKKPGAILSSGAALPGRMDFRPGNQGCCGKPRFGRPARAAGG